MHYQLSVVEKERLVKAVNNVLSIPFIDDLEDFIWEAVFSYAKGLTLIDPLISIRSKRLFDVVDEKTKIGWSAKAVQWPIKIPGSLELVIQRADIFKKAEALGFPPLDKNSDPNLLGQALMKHWMQEKVVKDAVHQGVTDKRVCILIKSRNRKKFVYLEESLTEYLSDDIEWHWSDETKTGLQGTKKKDGTLVFRWYPNQKQLFERFTIPEDSFVFELDPKRMTMSHAIEVLFKDRDNP